MTAAARRPVRRLGLTSMTDDSETGALLTQSVLRRLRDEIARLERLLDLPVAA